MTKVLIVDDQALVRAGFRVLIESADDLDVVGEAADGVEATGMAHTTKPDVILMDIRMPQMDGLEATRRILADPACGACKVIVLTTFDLDEYVFEGLRSGASGFLLKDIEPTELLEAIRIVASGDALLAPSVTRRLIEEFVRTPASPKTDSAALASLTEREREVVALVARGLSNAEIAKELFISPATAKTHVSRAMLKLGARDRAQLVVMAYEAGLASPGAA